MKTIIPDAYDSPETQHHRVVVTRHGGPNVLQLMEENRPESRAGEARVKVLVAGVSAYDLMFRRFSWLPGTPRVPFSLGAEVVGLVDKLGDNVSAFEPGSLARARLTARSRTSLDALPASLPCSDVAPSEGATCDPAQPKASFSGSYASKR